MHMIFLFKHIIFKGTCEGELYVTLEVENIDLEI